MTVPPSPWNEADESARIVRLFAGRPAATRQCDCGRGQPFGRASVYHTARREPRSTGVPDQLPGPPDAT